MALSDYLKYPQHILVYKLLLCIGFFGFESGSEALLLPFRQVRKAAKNALRTLRRNGIALEVGKEMFVRRVQVSQLFFLLTQISLTLADMERV